MLGNKQIYWLQKRFSLPKKFCLHVKILKKILAKMGIRLVHYLTEVRGSSSPRTTKLGMFLCRSQFSSPVMPAN